MAWFETVLARNVSGQKWLVGRKPGYVDFSLFQIVGGLAFAYPGYGRR
jgi:glutathione S-transferase